jgi:hypothetical protein
LFLSFRTASKWSRRGRSARATTTAARILSTILLCGNLEITLYPQSIYGFRIFLNTSVHLSVVLEDSSASAPVSSFPKGVMP